MLFWSNATAIQLESHHLISWKFCHLLHTLIRDGHSSVIDESIRYGNRIARAPMMTNRPLHFAQSENPENHFLNSEYPRLRHIGRITALGEYWKRKEALGYDSCKNIRLLETRLVLLLIVRRIGDIAM